MTRIGPNARNSEQKAELAHGIQCNSSMHQARGSCELLASLRVSSEYGSRAEGQAVQVGEGAEELQPRRAAERKSREAARVRTGVQHRGTLGHESVKRSRKWRVRLISSVMAGTTQNHGCVMTTLSPLIRHLTQTTRGRSSRSAETLTLIYPLISAPASV